MQTVYFDGSCPKCVRDVAFYRRHNDRPVIWYDVSKLPEDADIDGVKRNTLMAILHVQDEDGHWLVETDAFAAVWRLVPFLRPFAWIYTMPGLRQIWTYAYRWSLRKRYHNAYIADFLQKQEANK